MVVAPRYDPGTSGVAALAAAVAPGAAGTAPGAAGTPPGAAGTPRTLAQPAVEPPPPQPPFLPPGSDPVNAVSLAVDLDPGFPLARLESPSHPLDRRRLGPSHWRVALVPALGIDEIVLDGASGRTLAFAPGHLDGSAAPAGPGITVLAGHRDTHFRFLRDLKPGMLLILEAADGHRRRYRVTATHVVDKRRTDVAAATTQPTLTLITCYPFDAVAPGGPQRYVVEAAGIDATPPPTQRAEATPSPASPPTGGYPAGGL
jgi:LPXTG-site transpeptidase (sortase) family protein